MHPFLLQQPASAAATTPAAVAHAEQENRISTSDNGGSSAAAFSAAAATTTAAAAAAAAAANASAAARKRSGGFPPAAASANSLDIAALALTPRSEAAARAAAAQLAPVAAASAAANANAAAPPPPPPSKVRLRIEARLRASHPAAASPALRRELERQLSLLLRDRSWVYQDGPVELQSVLAGASQDLLAAVEHCAVVDTELDAARPAGTVLLFWQVELAVACYAVSSEPAAVPPSLADDDGEGQGGGGGGAPPYKEMVLPHASLEGSLAALALPRGAKARVLRRLGAALALGGAGVDPRLVPSGRLALLVGPPGTGKTSLCRAAAQRLAIRLCGNGGCDSGSGSTSRFPGGALLLEVSAPALFSKWFSESGRAVARLFERVAALATEEKALVFVLIDEVESLAGSRTPGNGGGGGGSSSSSGGGGDPGDAMRAVNALLTGLDALRDSAPGTCVLCTSNLGGMIDAAFVDRADVVLHLGPPPAVARYSMLAASVAELCRARIVGGAEPTPTLGEGGGGGGGGGGQPLSPSSSSALLPLSLPEEAFSSSLSSPLPPLAARLAEIAAATEGLSGRSLRRLPFAALADAVGLSGLEEASSSESSSSSSSGIDAFVFMEALKAAAEAERASRGFL